MTQERTLRGGLAMVLFLLATAAPAAAQPPQRQRTPDDTLVSPEVSADHEVTFHIYAPQASEVSVGGDFVATPPAPRLTKDEKGVWSVTVGPLTPDLYSYSFTVDGVKTVDPKNPLIKQGIAGVDSMVFVSGPEAEFEALQKVPHGDVRKVWYPSSTLNTQ